MFKRFWLIFLFLFGSNSIFGQSEIKLLKQGLKYAYNLDLQKADSVFNKFIDSYPNSPAGYYYLSQNHFWKYLGCRDQAELMIFERFSDLALNKAEKNINDRNDNFSKFILGSVFTLKAAANTTRGDSWKAFLNAKNAVNQFEEILEKDPNYFDANLGLGIFNYALSFVPGLFKFALDITGLDYDREEAVIYLNKAFEKGELTSDEAAFHLSKIYFEYLGDYRESHYFIDLLIDKYPENVLFYYQKALLEIEMKRLDEAEKLLTKVIEMNKRYFSQTTSFSNFLLGDIYFKRNKFQKAVEYFEKFFNSTATVDYLGYANFRCALAYYFLGDSVNYRHYLLLAGNGNPDVDEDEFASEMSTKLLGDKISAELKNFIIADNYYSAGDMDGCLNFIDSVNVEKLNSITIIKAAALTEKGNYAESIKLLDDFGYDNLLFEWLNPFGHLILGIDFCNTGRNEEAKEQFNIAEKNADGYRSNYIKSKINYWRTIINK